MNEITNPSSDYELLDSGEGEKLERYADIIVSRPDPQALWSKNLPENRWKEAQAVFKDGKWKNNKDGFTENWKVTLSNVTCNIKLSPFKHLGIFPEQSEHWTWLQNLIKNSVQNRESKISVLNLFGYTGGASIAAAKAGAEVTHVDSSESSVKWAKLNRNASDLREDSIRFIVDDVRKFVEREIKRGKKYDIVIMDPPVYGRGSKNELWKIENDLIPLLSKIKKILSPNPVAILVNGYASGYSHVAYKQALQNITSDLGGTLNSGEIFIKESNRGYLLPCGIYAKWQN